MNETILAIVYAILWFEAGFIANDLVRRYFMNKAMRQARAEIDTIVANEMERMEKAHAELEKKSTRDKNAKIKKNTKTTRKG